MNSQRLGFASRKRTVSRTLVPQRAEEWLESPQSRCRSSMDAVDVEDRCMVSTNGDVSKRDVTTAKYFFKKKLFWCTAV